MPLNEDSSVLSAFREMGYVPVFSKKRGTRGNPESLKSLTEKFLIKIKNRNPSLLTRIRTDWGKIAGANFAKYCEPQNIRAGILYIAAENSAVKQELSFNLHKILPKLQKLEGRENIRKIRLL